MYGSLIQSARGDAVSSRLLAYVVLGVSVIVLLSVLHLVLLTNEVVAMLRPPNLPPPPHELSNTTGASLAGDTTSRKPHILIVHEDHPHTRLFGAEVARGASSVTPSVRTLNPLNGTMDDILWADGIILGSNVYNANVDPKLMEWVNGWNFQVDLSNKVGGAFAIAGGMSSGEELTLVNLLHTMLSFRFIVVGGESWTSPLGASAVVNEGPFAQVNSGSQLWPSVCYRQSEEISALFLEKAYGLGHRVAHVSSKLVGHSSV